MSEKILTPIYADLCWQSRAERAEAEYDELRGAYEDLMERLCAAFDCPNPNAVVEHVQALFEMAQERERAAVASCARLREVCGALLTGDVRECNSQNPGWLSLNECPPGHPLECGRCYDARMARAALDADQRGATLAAALDAWCEARRRTDAAKTRSSYSFAVQEEGRRAEALEKAWRGKSDAE